MSKFGTTVSDSHRYTSATMSEKADLETCQVQLSQVEIALSKNPDDAELSSLRSELQEPIDLTQTAQAEAASSSKAESSHEAATTAPSKTWSAGDECLAKYSRDGGWYPARITSLLGSADNRVYSIVFKGYNTTELVKFAEIKALPANYATTPPSSSNKRK